MINKPSLYSTIYNALGRFAVLLALTVIVTFSSAGLAQAKFSSEGYAKSPPSFSNYQDITTPDDGPIEDSYLFFDDRFTKDVGNGNHKNTALQIICDTGYLTERIVHCIRKVIDSSVLTFMETMETALEGYILGLVVLAVTLFGGQVLSGSVEKPGPAAFTLLLKVAAVLLFTRGLGNFFPFVFGSMETMSGVAMSYISEGQYDGYLGGCSDISLGDVSIWRRIDCILTRMFTGEINGVDSTEHVGVLWVLAVAIFWTNFLGILVFFVMCAVFLMLFLLVLRCVYMFLAAYAFLALLVIISPLIIPLVLFKNTMNYFNKWWRQFLSMMVQPMILFAYMSFVFALIDGMFFRDEPYSLVRILGPGWENPALKEGTSQNAINEKMEAYKNETGCADGEAVCDSHRRLLENQKKYMTVGNVNIAEAPLIPIEINLADKATSGLQDLPVVGRAVAAGATVVDAVGQWGADKIADVLLPFTVPVIDPMGRHPWSFLWDMLKFFMIVLVIMPLLLKFTQDLPRLIQALSSAIRTPGAVMPGEKQIYGSIGAVKGATKGVVRGAITGFVTGGKKGAVVGAAEGGLREGRQGYKDAANEAGGGGGGRTAHAGGSNTHDVHAKGGEGSDRKILHGDDSDSSGGKLGGRGTGLKSAGKELAFRYATRGKGGAAGGAAGAGGKGGGAGGGKAGGGGAGGKAGMAAKGAK